MTRIPLVSLRFYLEYLFGLLLLVRLLVLVLLLLLSSVVFVLFGERRDEDDLLLRLALDPITDLLRIHLSDHRQLVAAEIALHFLHSWLNPKKIEEGRTVILIRA